MNAIELGEVGVQVAAYLHGQLFVDTWAGHADTAQERPVDGDTLFNIFSVTKAVTALALHLQAERGRVAYDAPVARYWPEFAAHGKGRVTVRDVLTHRAGVVQMPEDIRPEQLNDWNWIVDQIADTPPLFPPGSRTTYLAYTFGWILGEVVIRTDPQRRTFPRFVDEELLAPLGVRDLWLGIPDSVAGRVAQLSSTIDDVSPAHAPYRALAMPPAVAPSPAIYSQPAVQRACIPGAGGIANARSVARVFALLAGRGAVGGMRLLSTQRVDDFSRPRPNTEDYDEVVGRVCILGQGGFWLGGPCPPSEPVIGTNRHTLAHNGAGGSIAWADPDVGLAVAITHNRMFRQQPVLSATEHPFIPIGDAVRRFAHDIYNIGPLPDNPAL